MRESKFYQLEKGNNYQRNYYQAYINSSQNEVLSRCRECLNAHHSEHQRFATT